MNTAVPGYQENTAVSLVVLRYQKILGLHSTSIMGIWYSSGTMELQVSEIPTVNNVNYKKVQVCL